MGIMVKVLVIFFVLGVLLLRQVVGLCMHGRIYIIYAMRVFCSRKPFLQLTHPTSPSPTVNQLVSCIPVMVF